MDPFIGSRLNEICDIGTSMDLCVPIYKYIEW